MARLFRTARLFSLMKNASRYVDSTRQVYSANESKGFKTPLYLVLSGSQNFIDMEKNLVVTQC